MPYPLTDGGRKGVFYPLKLLAQRGHSIFLTCFVKEEDRVSQNILKDFCTLTTTFKSTHPTAIGGLRSLVQKLPYLVTRFHDQRHLEKMLDIIRAGVDLVQIEGIHAAYYGMEIKKRFSVPIVLRHHNLASSNLRTYLRWHPNVLMRGFLRLEFLKLLQYERSVSSLLDRFLMVSPEDEKALLSLAQNTPTVVIPEGVDADYFVPSKSPREPDTILWLGSLQWPPNQDSFFWFYRHIFPLILREHPGAVLSVVGTNPPATILDLKHPNLKVLGFVEDIRPEVHKASVCVVPLRAGSGIRIKLLEMFAMGKAVVSTSLGCEGLGVEHGVHLRVADEPQSFAHAVVGLLKNAEECGRLGKAALNHVKRRFTWEAIVDQYEQVYGELLSSRSGKSIQ